MISKEAAENVIYGLLARTMEWNLATHAPYRVWMIAVLGSYLGDEENLGGVTALVAFHIPDGIPPDTDKAFAVMKSSTLKALQGTAPALTLVDITHGNREVADNCVLYLEGDVNATDFWS